MKIKLLLSYSTVFVFLLSCGSDKKENSETQESVPEQTTALPEIINADSVQPSAAGTQTIELPAGPATAPSAVSAIPASTATGLNPAHGEPGHRCDIAVGAPLNSPPGNITPSTPITVGASQGSQPQQITIPASPAPGQTQSIQVAPPTVNTPTPPGMNPPHGEPGHDCAIPVGAPLKK